MQPAQAFVDSVTLVHPKAAAPVAAPVAVAGVKVWDLPTRLFHWALVLCVTGAVLTAKLGGNWMEWHPRLGIATLALLAFRLVWGLIGPRYARFGSFRCSPKAAWRHTRKFKSAECHAGHNPSGAISVLAMLAVLIMQTMSGLFSSDAIGTDGPLARYATEAAVSWSTLLHLRLQWVIYALIGLHLGAVVAYLVLKHDNLIVPMLSGRKHGLSAEPAADGWGVRIAGLLLFAAAFGLAFWWLQE